MCPPPAVAHIHKVGHSCRCLLLLLLLLPLLLFPAALSQLQAEAAAKLAQYQQNLRQLLSSIGKTGNIADDAQLLYKLADQLFGSPLNVCELVSQGGVPVILTAARSALQALTGDAARSDVLPALMQVGSLQESLQERACRTACRKVCRLLCSTLHQC